MSVLNDLARIDTLIALALSRGPGRGATRPEDDEEEGPVSGADAQGGANVGEEFSGEESDDSSRLLSGLGASDRRAVERRRQSHAKLPGDEQTRWIERTLERARHGRPEHDRRFDKNIHPTHIAEALRDEPARVQRLILRALAPPQAGPAAAALGPAVVREGGDGRGDGAGANNSPDKSPPGGDAAAAKLAAVVRQAFRAQFVTADELANPTALDLLSGVELVRLIRLLGVRETAVACRGIAAVETVTSFLRRFSAEDAHAIAAHVAAFTTVEPQRADFAERIALQAIGEEFDGATMLDQVGMSLLAVALEARGPARRRYTAQKLPLAASRELLDLVVRSRSFCERDVARRIDEEAEALAVNLRRPARDDVAERRAGPAYETPSRGEAEMEGANV